MKRKDYSDGTSDTNGLVQKIFDNTPGKGRKVEFKVTGRKDLRTLKGKRWRLEAMNRT